MVSALSTGGMTIQPLGDTSLYGQMQGPTGTGGMMVYNQDGSAINGGRGMTPDYLAANGGGSGAGGGGASGSSSWNLPSSITAPTMGTFNYSSDAINYPTYMRNLGENMAQQTFQTNVNQGIRLGNSVQGYQRAMDARNNARLGYMSQAGQQDLLAQSKLADENAKRNDELLRMFGINVTQRGQDVGYASDMYRYRNTGGGGGGVVLGGNRNIPQQAPGGRAGTYIPMTPHNLLYDPASGWAGVHGTDPSEGGY